MQSRHVVDLRKRAPSSKTAHAPLPLREAPRRRRRDPLRRRRLRLRVILSLALLVLLAASTWGVSALSYLPRLTIEKVEVRGAATVSPRLLRAFVGAEIEPRSHPFFSPDNIFLYDPSTLESAIVERFPRIASASAGRSSLLSRTLVVEVTERKPFAKWCAPDRTSTGGNTQECYQMDQTGFVFAPAATSAATSSSFAVIAPGGVASSTGATSTPSYASPYVFSGGLFATSSPVGQSFVSGHLPGLVVLLRLLGQAGFFPQGASVQGAEDFFVPLSEGYYLKASFGEDASALVKNLGLVLSSERLREKQHDLEYVDLRFGDRVYYKFKGQSEVSAP